MHRARFKTGDNSDNPSIVKPPLAWTARYGFGEKRVAWLTLLTFTTLSA